MVPIVFKRWSTEYTETVNYKNQEELIIVTNTINVSLCELL